MRGRVVGRCADGRRRRRSVLRLFGRLRSLKQIMLSIGLSFKPGVCLRVRACVCVCARAFLSVSSSLPLPLSLAPALALP